jgi:hypothetical protein
MVLWWTLPFLSAACKEATRLERFHDLIGFRSFLLEREREREREYE